MLRIYYFTTHVTIEHAHVSVITVHISYCMQLDYFAMQKGVRRGNTFCSEDAYDLKIILVV